MVKIQFHYDVVDLFRPLYEQQGQRACFKRFNAKDNTVKAVVRASLEQLKRLLVACHDHYPRAFYSPVANAASLHLGNAMLHGARAPDGD